MKITKLSKRQTFFFIDKKNMFHSEFIQENHYCAVILGEKVVVVVHL